MPKYWCAARDWPAATGPGSSLPEWVSTIGATSLCTSGAKLTGPGAGPAASGIFPAAWPSLVVFEDMLEAFTAATGLQYNISVGPSPPEVRASPEDPGPYDFWLVGPEALSSPGAQGAVVDTTFLLQNDPDYDFWDISIAWRSSMLNAQSNSFNTVPATVQPLLQLYRADLFAAHGLHVPHTWRELIEVAAAANGQDLDGDGLPEVGVCLDSSLACGAYGTIVLYILSSMVQLRGPSDGIAFDPADLSLLAQGEALQEALRVFSELQRLGLPDSSPCMAQDMSPHVEGRCLVTLGTPLAFKAVSHPASTSPLRGSLGVAPLPGASQVLDRSSGRLVPCSPALCPFAEETLDTDSGEMVLTNKVTGFRTYGLAINRFAPTHRQAAAFKLATTLFGAWHKQLVFNLTEVGPTRHSDLDPDAWIAAGYDPANTRAYLAEYQRSFVGNPNIFREMRFPGVEAFEALFKDLVYDVVWERKGVEGAVAVFRRRVQELVSSMGGRHHWLPQYRMSLGIKQVATAQGDDGGEPSPAAARDPKVLNDILLGAVLPGCSVLVLVLLCKLNRLHRRAMVRCIQHGKTDAPGPGELVLCVTDIQDSTSLWETLPADVMQEAVRVHHSTIRRFVAQYGGYESATEGDSFILAFHTVANCTRFALRTQEALMEADWPADLLSSDYASSLSVRCDTSALRPWMRGACGQTIRTLLKQARHHGRSGSQPLADTSNRGAGEPSALPQGASSCRFRYRRASATGAQLPCDEALTLRREAELAGPDPRVRRQGRSPATWVSVQPLSSSRIRSMLPSPSHSRSPSVLPPYGTETSSVPFPDPMRSEAPGMAPETGVQVSQDDGPGSRPRTLSAIGLLTLPAGALPAEGCESSSAAAAAAPRLVGARERRGSLVSDAGVLRAAACGLDDPRVGCAAAGVSGPAGAAAGGGGGIHAPAMRMSHLGVGDSQRSQLSAGQLVLPTGKACLRQPGRHGGGGRALSPWAVLRASLGMGGSASASSTTRPSRAIWQRRASSGGPMVWPSPDPTVHRPGAVEVEAERDTGASASGGVGRSRVFAELVDLDGERSVQVADLSEVAEAPAAEAGDANRRGGGGDIADAHAHGEGETDMLPLPSTAALTVAAGTPFTSAEAVAALAMPSRSSPGLAGVLTRSPLQPDSCHQPHQHLRPTLPSHPKQLGQQHQQHHPRGDELSCQARVHSQSLPKTQQLANEVLSRASCSSQDTSSFWTEGAEKPPPSRTDGSSQYDDEVESVGFEAFLRALFAAVPAAPEEQAGGRDGATDDVRPVFRGLRVRIGYHRGVAGEADVQFNRASQRTVYSGAVLQQAKAVSDAGRGGQITLSAAALAALDFVLLFQEAGTVLHSGRHVLREGEPEVELYSLFGRSLVLRLAFLEPPRSLGLRAPGVLAAPLGHLAVAVAQWEDMAGWGLEAASGYHGAIRARAQELANHYSGYMLLTGPGALQTVFPDPGDAVRWLLALQDELQEGRVACCPLALGASELQASSAFCPNPLMRGGVDVGLLQAGLTFDGRMSYEGPTCKRAGCLAAHAPWQEVLVSFEVASAVLQEGDPQLAALTVARLQLTANSGAAISLDRSGSGARQLASAGHPTLEPAAIPVGRLQRGRAGTKLSGMYTRASSARGVVTAAINTSPSPGVAVGSGAGAGAGVASATLTRDFSQYHAVRTSLWSLEKGAQAHAHAQGSASGPCVPVRHPPYLSNRATSGGLVSSPAEAGPPLPLSRLEKSAFSLPPQPDAGLLLAYRSRSVTETVYATTATATATDTGTAATGSGPAPAAVTASQLQLVVDPNPGGRTDRDASVQARRLKEALKVRNRVMVDDDLMMVMVPPYSNGQQAAGGGGGGGGGGAGTSGGLGCGGGGGGGGGGGSGSLARRRSNCGCDHGQGYGSSGSTFPSGSMPLKQLASAGVSSGVGSVGGGGSRPASGPYARLKSLLHLSAKVGNAPSPAVLRQELPAGQVESRGVHGFATTSPQVNLTVSPAPLAAAAAAVSGTMPWEQHNVASDTPSTPAPVSVCATATAFLQPAAAPATRGMAADVDIATSAGKDGGQGGGTAELLDPEANGHNSCDRGGGARVSPHAAESEASLSHGPVDSTHPVASRAGVETCIEFDPSPRSTTNNHSWVAGSASGPVDPLSGAVTAPHGEDAPREGSGFGADPEAAVARRNGRIPNVTQPPPPQHDTAGRVPSGGASDPAGLPSLSGPLRMSSLVDRVCGVDDGSVGSEGATTMISSRLSPQQAQHPHVQPQLRAQSQPKPQSQPQPSAFARIGATLPPLSTFLPLPPPPPAAAAAAPVPSMPPPELQLSRNNSCSGNYASQLLGPELLVPHSAMSRFGRMSTMSNMLTRDFQQDSWAAVAEDGGLFQPAAGPGDCATGKASPRGVLGSGCAGGGGGASTPAPTPAPATGKAPNHLSAHHTRHRGQQQQQHLLSSVMDIAPSAVSSAGTLTVALAGSGHESDPPADNAGTLEFACDVASLAHQTAEASTAEQNGAPAKGSPVEISPSVTVTAWTEAAAAPAPASSSHAATAAKQLYQSPQWTSFTTRPSVQPRPPSPVAQPPNVSAGAEVEEGVAATPAAARIGTSAAPDPGLLFTHVRLIRFKGSRIVACRVRFGPV